MVVMSCEAYIASSRGNDARGAYVAAAAQAMQQARQLSKKCAKRFRGGVGMLVSGLYPY